MPSLAWSFPCTRSVCFVLGLVDRSLFFCLSCCCFSTRWQVLQQIASNPRSFSLYAKLGFEVKSAPGAPSVQHVDWYHTAVVPSLHLYALFLPRVGRRQVGVSKHAHDRSAPSYPAPPHPARYFNVTMVATIFLLAGETHMPICGRVPRAVRRPSVALGTRRRRGCREGHGRGGHRGVRGPVPHRARARLRLGPPGGHPRATGGRDAVPDVSIRVLIVFLVFLIGVQLCWCSC